MGSIVNPWDVQSYYRRFRRQGYEARIALKYARAMDVAHRLDWEFSWKDEQDPDFSFVKYWSKEEQKRFWEKEHECLWLAVIDEQDGIMDSLGNIIDATEDYKLSCEAEMAVNAIYKLDLFDLRVINLIAEGVKFP